MTPAKLRALAFELADEHALGTITSLCSPADEAAADGYSHRAWFMPGRNDEGRGDILESLRYLVARKLVIVNRRARIVCLR
jgi:hypothetical protein